MKPFVCLVLIILLSGAAVAAEQGPTDTAQIKQTVRNYLEGWFGSDPARMTEALHPNLFKCRVQQIQGSEAEIVRVMTAEELIALTKINHAWVQDKKGLVEMEIVYQDGRLAVVHAVSDGFYDVAGLIKINGEWKILQVLWDRNEGQGD